MENIQDFFIPYFNAINIFTNTELRFFAGYLIAMVVIGFFLYRKANEQSGFFSWLFPKSMYLHASTLTDIKLFLFGRILTVVGVFNNIAVTVYAATVVHSWIHGNVDENSTLHPLLIGFIILLAADFGTYVTHRVHHEAKVLWPFHAVHHSAEVLTPVTVYRKHPIYDLISTLIKSLLKGLIVGLLLSLFVSKIEYLLLVGTTSFYVIFNLVGANFRHTHVWLSYGRVLEHIFISPAQHQIHHSVAKEHWNKNYGEIFAIWDWMFGTLYVPQEKEILEFGIAGMKGEAQPHKNLSQALIYPLKQSWKALKREPQKIDAKPNTKTLLGE